MRSYQKFFVSTVLAGSIALAGGVANAAPGLDEPVTTVSESTTAEAASIADSEKQIIPLSDKDIDWVNDEAEKAGEQGFPEGTATLVIQDGVAHPADANGKELPSTRSFWGTTWKYTQCAAAVAVAFVPAGKAYTAIKGLGGVAATARLLVGAGSAGDFLAIGGGAAAEILGISVIKSKCF